MFCKTASFIICITVSIHLLPKPAYAHVRENSHVSTFAVQPQNYARDYTVRHCARLIWHLSPILSFTWGNQGLHQFIMDSSTNSSGVIVVDELPRDNVTATMTVNWMGGDEPLASNCRVLRERFTHIYPVDSWKAEGFFTDEDLLDIGCHWLKYEPVRQSIHFSLAIAYAVLFIIGFTSNLLVVYIILRYANWIRTDCSFSTMSLFVACMR